MYVLMLIGHMELELMMLKKLLESLKASKNPYKLFI